MGSPSEPRKPSADTGRVPSPPPPPQFGDTIGFIENVEPLHAPGEPGYRDPFLWAEGEQVGRYTIQKLIARGGMSYVYLGVETGAKNRVAIKVLPPSPLWTERAIARFDREISVLARIRHPNVVRFIEGGVRNGARFYVMEYIPGDTVEDILQQKRRCAPVEAASIVRALARVLHAIHEQGIIHRDIKPSNIIITPRGVPKIADFGIARILEDESLTLTSEIVGTPFYMSPEQIQGRKELVDRRTDVYSLGVILYELVARQLPFTGDNLATVTYNVVHNEPVPPSSISPYRIPKALDVIVLRALEKDPARRYPTAAALSEELDQFLGGEDVSHSLAERGRQAARFMCAHAGAIGIGLALVALLIVGLAFVPQVLSNLIPRQGPPAGPVAPPTPAPAPAHGPDASMEAEAQALVEFAFRAVENGNWWVARERFERLAAAYAGTAAYRDADARIGEALLKCRERIAALDKSVEENRRQAESAFRAGHWTAARRGYETLTAIAAGPYEKDRPGWLARARECEREIEAATEIAFLKKLEAEQKWTTLLDRARRFEQQFDGTATHRDSRAALSAMRSRAGPEGEAEEELGAAERHFRLKRWEALEEILARLARHRETDAYRKRRAEIEDWETRALTEPPAEALYREIEILNSRNEYAEMHVRIGELRAKHGTSLVVAERAARLDELEMNAAASRTEERERAAEEEWNRAKAFLRTKRYSEAFDSLQKLLEGEYSRTRVVKDSRTEMLQARDEADRPLKRELANDLFAKLKNAQRARNWSEMYHLARELDQKYKEGDFLPASKKREIQPALDEAVAMLTRMDMQGTFDEWKRHDASTTAGKTGEVAQVPVQPGSEDKCLRFSAANSTIFYAAIPPVPPEATHLAFHVAADKTDVPIQALLGSRDQKSLASVSHYFTWNVQARAGRLLRVELRLSDFRPPASGIETGGERKPFDVIGFSIGGNAVVFVDNVEFRVQK
jgi:hypothetical protein